MWICGIDEAGKGPVLGPMVAAGVLVSDDEDLSSLGIRDSKQLSAKKRDKIFEDMDTDEKIEMFIKEFKIDVKYPAKTFYDWHHKLTGSCVFGRNAFVKNHGIDIENEMYTVKEFIDITKHDFGGEIIQQLEERLEE